MRMWENQWEKHHPSDYILKRIIFLARLERMSTNEVNQTVTDG